MRKKVLLLLAMLALFATSLTTGPKGGVLPGLDTCTNPNPVGSCPPG